MAIFLALVPASGVQAQTVPPSIKYGPLYRDVQLRGIFPDSKTFPDLIPHATPQNVVRNYTMARQAPISISRASSAPTSPAQSRQAPR